MKYAEIKIIVEVVNTPLEERVEEKKYKYILDSETHLHSPSACLWLMDNESWVITSYDKESDYINEFHITERSYFRAVYNGMPDIFNRKEID